MPEVKRQSKNNQSFPDRIFKALTFASALIIIVLMAGLFLQLAIHSIPTIKKFGFGFFYSKAWNPVTEQFGALSCIYGTLVTTAIADVIAVPVSFVIALFLLELASPV